MGTAHSGLTSTRGLCLRFRYAQSLSSRDPRSSDVAERPPFNQNVGALNEKASTARMAVMIRDLVGLLHDRERKRHDMKC